MRRAFAAIVLTVLGLFLVLDYKSSPATRPSTGVLALPPSTTTEPQDNSGPPPTTFPPGTGDPLTPTTQFSGPPATLPASPTSAPPTTAVPKGGPPRTVTGPVVTTAYGDVQVAVTISGNHITDVTALTLPTERARSAEISQYAAPILRSEVLAAQSAQIDTVSGATYTSAGYAQSLQAALTQANG